MKRINKAQEQIDRAYRNVPKEYKLSPDEVCVCTFLTDGSKLIQKASEREITKDDITWIIKGIFLVVGEDYKNYIIEWGRDGFEALNENYKYLYNYFEGTACIKHRQNPCLNCYVVMPDLTNKDKGVVFIGMRHTWDRRKKGYKVIHKVS